MRTLNELSKELCRDSDEFNRPNPLLHFLLSFLTNLHQGSSQEEHFGVPVKGSFDPPTSLGSCISVHLKKHETHQIWLFVFIWATFKRRNYSDSSCLLISFCQIQEVRQVQESAAGTLRSRSEGRRRRGRGGSRGWSLPQVGAAIGFGRLCPSRFASSGVVSL